MTKTSLYIIAAFIGTSLFSCADLDRLPIDEVASENGWKNNDDAEKAVNKLYTCAPEWDGESIVGLTDEAINSDDAVHGIKWAEGNLAKGVYDPQDFSWKSNYETIRNANIIILNTPNITSMTDAQTNNILAQARFFRAYQYFQLIRQFGDVPYTDSPLKLSDQENITRTPKAEVYKHILKILTLQRLIFLQNGTERMTPASQKEAHWL